MEMEEVEDEKGEDDEEEVTTMEGLKSLHKNIK